MTNQQEKEMQLTVPFEPLAEKYNLSVRATQNIIYRASEQLFKHVKF